MKLLAPTHTLWRRLTHPSNLLTAAAAGVLVGVEVVGRQTTTDLHDCLAASLLALVGLLLSLRHQSASSWGERVKRLGRKALAVVKGYAFDIGIDLRGTPPVPRGTPGPVLAVLGGLLAWGVFAAVCGPSLPHGLRAVGQTVFYVGYLALLSAFWAVLFFAILLAVFIPTAVIHDALVGRWDGPGPRPRRAQAACVAAYFATLFMAGWLFPLWVHLALCLVALTVNLLTIALPANGDIQFLWRGKGGKPVRSIPWGWWVTIEFGIMTLVLVDLSLTACGGRVFTGSADARTAMPITSTLGTVLTWLSPGVLGALVLQTVLGRLRDPARGPRPAARVGGDLKPAERSAVRAVFDKWGWDVSFAGTADVAVELVPAERSEATEFEPAWPLKVSLDDLQSGRVRDRLERRDEIQKRRQVVGAVEKLFKRAARRKYQAGTGFWVAPHFWFVAGLSRDAQEEELDVNEGAVLSGTIGQPYHRVMSRATRHYLYRVLRAMQVDLIFVEDGVGHRKFAKVLRRLFEVYDKGGGKRRAEDAQFTGLVGTRVIIHEFALDEPFKSETYPEPKYDYLGRARILHVFKDRGEQDEPLETPFDFSFTPAPLLVG